jgi:hypothetical protein
MSLLLPKVSFSNTFFVFCFFIKKAILPNFAEFLVVGMLSSCAGVFPRKESGIQVLAGFAISSQTVG